jgi:DNA-directed RNA polymerase specialized sigma24 family protein
VSADITALLAAAEQGDRSAADAVFTALYDELRRMARRELGRNSGVTLSATTLLHDAYLDLSARSNRFRIAIASWGMPRA